ncbi:SDR family NAD(P)-dependent oxidoreductase [Dactylosporangium roseum]|uniref:SDR family NAD(P)-dependent oxidoreductase n=1 Tax=Dactylosporangium roseum TaxID=47989 RepID=UPI0021B1C595|nr:SDR family NAD(P)-dependent oxidoreductase [Dactylosporangium roseum]
MLLEGKVAVVTGAGTGLGRAEAIALARSGAFVVVNDLGVALDGAPDENRAESVVSEIRKFGGEAVAHAGDVSDFDAAGALVECAVSTYGSLDILVNNAGILRDRMIFNMSVDDWDAVIRVHLRGHFNTSRWATSHWRRLARRTGEPAYGRIVNTASEAFLLGSPGQPNYAAAKAGIVSLTLATARSCAKYGVLANAICPRANTRMTGTERADGDPDDPFGAARVTPLVTYLASPRAARVSGQVFVVYGGMIALLKAPAVDRRFDAGAAGWTAESLAGELEPLFATRTPVEDGYLATELRALASDSWNTRER